MIANPSFLLLILALVDLEPGFKSLLPADPASAFEMIKIDATSVTFVDGEIKLTGVPRGYLASKEVYGDFILRFEWRFEAPNGTEPAKFEGNSGVLLRIKTPHKVWPRCLEYQIHLDDPASLFAIDGDFVGTTDPEAQKLASRSLDRWNESEIEMKGKTVVSRLNGQEIARGTYEGGAGPIGFQSQGGAIRFRNPRIKTIPPP